MLPVSMFQDGCTERFNITQSIDNAYRTPNNDTHHAFQSTPASVASRTAMRIRAYDAMSNACAEEWVVYGQWGSACVGTNLSEGLKIDGVWAWVNGSDPVQVASRQQFRPDSPMKMDAAHRYADHNELLYSMRSAVASLGSNVMSRMHILASAYWVQNQSHGDMAGQVPAWLDKDQALMGTGDVTLQHDAKYFKPVDNPQSEWTSVEAQQWWDASIPSFNSLAFESQIHNIENTSCDQLVYYNDDFFTMGRLAVSDLTTPLYGPVIKTITKLTSLYRPAENTLWRTWNPSGEEPGIMRAAWVLGRRFGMRSHYYITHHPRTLWLPLLREAAQTFPSAFSNTALSRFRAQSDAPPSIQTVFLASWYVVERHREALLWSWVVAKWGGRYGVLDHDTKQRMWQELADGKSPTSSYLNIDVPVRVPVENVRAFENAGIDIPISTEYSFSSKDGYALAYVDSMWFWNRPRHGYPDLTRGLIDVSGKGTGSDDDTRYSKNPNFVPDRACTIRWSECFASSKNDTANEFFKWIAFENQRCGDCIITGLIGASGISGIEKFVPEHNDDVDSTWFSDTQSEPPHLPLTSDWRTTDFSLSQAVPKEPGMTLRAWSIRLIQRYSYVLGSAASEMYKVERASDLESKLVKLEDRVQRDTNETKHYLDELSLKQQRNVDSQPEVYHRWRNHLGEGRGPLAFLCLNDDVKEKGGLRYVVDQLLLDYFRRMWSNRLECERVS
ncbi:hypothetical protein M409DRAFT_66840 [Zasmidium cellare ATCC 36951]|uniref:Stealth protein CR3 conserved region 3 domain-containing protein n=1 Tax=Zasmidium cellare ATCC 36951 TaxID=1080233 RepID=A0A6A6CF63_ZASCE|nr:uncharacterized protein M409DRAFT_66840 [Zasmidium cellare ATCC 36951]KAF2165854.1 hypothetical protein M409DRAFT_66840 [Zasmidium cellare ATCC 36951]